MLKDFINWIQYKIYLDKKQKFPKFREGDIWWCSFGTNVGVEMDGKNERFNRPVLILKKFNSRQFLAILLTSKEKNNQKFYSELDLSSKKSWLCLTQIRVLDSKRLQSYYTKINQNTLNQVKKQFIKLIE
jgi:mRNA interferase MazF